jgi:hypothetical protein
MVARSLLQSAGIHFVVQGERLQELIEPGRLGLNYSVPVGPVKLQVQAEYADDAREILNVKREKPGSESRVQELEHELMYDVVWCAGFGLAGFVAAYVAVPGAWDEPTRMLIYIVAAFCGALLGSRIRKSKKPEEVTEEVADEAASFEESDAEDEAPAPSPTKPSKDEK